MSRQLPPDNDTPQSSTPSEPCLAQLLRRKDLWRGHSQSFVEQAHWPTGHAQLDQALLHGGWPLSTLIEVCQASDTHSEWLLTSPVINQACTQGYTILLNPPAQPYVPGLAQQEINLDQLILVQAQTRTDFVASLVEILKAPICQLLLCWEPAQPLSYAELRKCQLATQHHAGLCMLFRQQRHQHQSSPASLRLSSQFRDDQLELNLFKQRGKKVGAPVHIALPAEWQALPLHNQLGGSQAGEHHGAEPQRTSARVFTFGRHQSDSQP